LLGAVTTGLFGFALWCCIQALFDTEGKGTTAEGLIARIGYAGLLVSRTLHSPAVRSSL
jgi:hypothetical protein